MPEPLTPERLEWIRRCNSEDKALHGASWADHYEPAERHRDELLAEVDRLNAEKARLREEAENHLLRLADNERAYRKAGDPVGVARQDYAAAEIRSLFGIEWKPGGEPRD